MSTGNKIKFNGKMGSVNPLTIWKVNPVRVMWKAHTQTGAFSLENGVMYAACDMELDSWRHACSKEDVHNNLVEEGVVWSVRFLDQAIWKLLTGYGWSGWFVAVSAMVCGCVSVGQVVRSIGVRVSASHPNTHLLEHPVIFQQPEQAVSNVLATTQTRVEGRDDHLQEPSSLWHMMNARCSGWNGDAGSRSAHQANQMAMKLMVVSMMVSAQCCRSLPST